MKTLRTAVLVALVPVSLLGACKKDYPQCDHFVDLTMTCDADMKSAPGGEQKTARVMMGGMCEEAFKNDTSNVSGQAKQLVTEMYAELRERADMVKGLGVNSRALGRGAITGEGGDHVWDYLSLEGRSIDDASNKHMHLTLGVGRLGVSAVVIVPDKLNTATRHRIAELGEGGF